MAQIKKKEFNLSQLNQELSNKNDNLAQIEHQLNELSCEHDHIKDEIVKFNNEILKENF